MTASGEVEGFSEYIRIDSDLEHSMTWDPEGVTSQH